MKKPLSYWIGFLILLLIGSCCLTSCAARKSNVDILETKDKHEITNTVTDQSRSAENSTENVKSITTLEVNEVTNTIIETSVDEPIDNSKPSTVVDKDGKKTELNNTKRTTSKTTILNDKKTKDISSIDKTKKVAKDSQNDIHSVAKDVDESESKSKNKNTNRSADYSWIMWAIIALLALRITYCVYKKTPFI